ncbi:MAG: aromatic ring-hydroxylating dioxygenase subunit alpha [Proteobacteria bacterium]|nr:aromatic ring-hydroxylating dioxygenase subunit alpha [Pseudomonadota bacterium]
MTLTIIETHTARTHQTFRKDRYVSQEVKALEDRAIWGNTWLLAGLASDVARPGDFFVFAVGIEQILVTRDEAGDLQAFFNVCQHRGNRLVCEAHGTTQHFRCPYHAWTFGLDGQLKSVPLVEKFAEDPRKANRHLKSVHVALWNGFVFVHLGSEPEPLLTFLGPVAERLAPYDFGAMTLVEDQTVQLDCNWKAVVDNFSELYHVDFLHPQHKRMVDCHNDTVRLYSGGHTGVEVPGGTVNQKFGIPDEPTDIQSSQLKSLDLDPADYKGRVLEVRTAIQSQKRALATSRGMPYSRFSDDQLSDVWQYNLFPNTILSFTPEHCWVLRPRPHALDPNQCEFDKISLVRFPDAATDQKPILGPASRDGVAMRPEGRPKRDLFSYQAVITGEKTMTDTIDQDVELLGQVQLGMRSNGFSDVYLNEDEARVQHFHAEWDRKMHEI